MPRRGGDEAADDQEGDAPRRIAEPPGRLGPAPPRLPIEGEPGGGIAPPCLGEIAEGCRRDGEADQRHEPTPHRLRQEPRGAVMHSVASTEAEAEAERGRRTREADIQDRADEMGAAHHQALERGAAPVGIRHGLHGAPQGEGQEPQGDQAHQHRPERSDEDLAQGVVAVAGTPAAERGEQGETAHEDVDRAARAIAEAREALQGVAPAGQGRCGRDADHGTLCARKPLNARAWRFVQGAAFSARPDRAT